MAKRQYLDFQRSSRSERSNQPAPDQFAELSIIVARASPDSLRLPITLGLRQGLMSLWRFSPKHVRWRRARIPISSEARDRTNPISPQQFGLQSSIIRRRPPPIRCPSPAGLGLRQGHLADPPRCSVDQFCMPQRCTVIRSINLKITFSTNRPIRMIVSRPAKTSGISS